MHRNNSNRIQSSWTQGCQSPE